MSRSTSLRTGKTRPHHLWNEDYDEVFEPDHSPKVKARKRHASKVRKDPEMRGEPRKLKSRDDDWDELSFDDYQDDADWQEYLSPRDLQRIHDDYN